MANTIFSKNLRSLRESKKIPQKSAAASLGISQALLSHYEKGIRECGLDFLTRAAKYYGVTTDFLLGVHSGSVSVISGARNCIDCNIIGGTVSDNIAEQFSDEIILSCANKIKDDEIKKDGVEINTYSILYKNLLLNALSYIFDEMKDIKYKDLSILSGKYLSLIIYRLYTLLYNNSENYYIDLSEKIFINELRYITALKKFRIDKAKDDRTDKSEENERNEENLFRKYNFGNPYLNNIINTNS